MKFLDKIIKENINRFILRESISSIVYHFTDISSLIQILDDDKFRLSVKSDDSENFGPESFYLSVSRIKSIKTGYPYSIGLNVRITLNGDRFNQRYRGKAVDFFAISGEKGAKHRYYDKPGSIPYAQENTENEDRIFSYEPSISNVWRYIERIDILCRGDYQYGPLNYLLEKYGDSGVIFVYDNTRDFENQNNNTINDTILNQHNFYKAISKSRFELDGRFSEAIFKIVRFLVEKSNIHSYEKAKTFLEQMFGRYGLSDYMCYAEKALDMMDLNVKMSDNYYVGKALQTLLFYDDYYKFGKMVGDFCRRKKIRTID